MKHKPGSRVIHIGSNSAGYFTLAIPEEDMEQFNLILNTAELHIGAGHNFFAKISFKYVTSYFVAFV